VTLELDFFIPKIGQHSSCGKKEFWAPFPRSLQGSNLRPTVPKTIALSTELKDRCSLIRFEFGMVCDVFENVDDMVVDEG
jgi:hypothetical protein